MTDDDNWEDYSSGPFCAHWGDLSNGCDEACGTCAHRCHSDSGDCPVEGCSCEECTDKDGQP